MTWINISDGNAEWYAGHAWQFGGHWLDPQDYPTGMEAEKHELGAIITPDGTIKHRIRQLCKTTTKLSLVTPKHWQT